MPVALGYGQRGPDVLDAQHKLYERGFLTEAQLRTGPGIYGPRTEGAVRALQRATNLPVTGALDSASARVLFEDAAFATATRGSDAARRLQPRRPVTGLRAPAPRAPAPSGFVGATRLDVTRGANGRAQVLDYTARMTIDADGSPDVSRTRQPGKIYDPWYRPDTAMSDHGRPIDANQVPFIVLPPELQRSTGARLGDLARVEYQGKTVYAIFADVGPRRKLGEGSMALARALDIPWDPHTGGASHGVRYTVLPGSGDGRSHDFATIQDRGAAAFAAVR